jgi:hypothetical protein
MKPTITPVPSLNRLLENGMPRGDTSGQARVQGYAPAEFAADPEAKGVTPKALAASDSTTILRWSKVPSAKPPCYSPARSSPPNQAPKYPA